MSDYLNNSKLSHTREAVFNYRLFYELKLSAINDGLDIQVVLPEIDKYGYDAILGDGDTMRPIQIKTTLTVSLRHRWPRIHKNLLRPQAGLASAFFKETSPTTVGLAGGIVLIQPVIDDTGTDIAQVNYFYSDFHIWALYKEGVITKTAANTRPRIPMTDRSQNSINELCKSGERITVPFHLFVKARDIRSLAALCDLNSGVSSSSISWLTQLYCRSQCQSERAAIRQQLEDIFKCLII